MFLLGIDFFKNSVRGDSCRWDNSSLTKFRAVQVPSRSLEAIRVPLSAPVFGPRQRIPRPSFQGPRLFLAPHFFNRAVTVCPPTPSRETSPDTPAPRYPPRRLPETPHRQLSARPLPRYPSPTPLCETASPTPPPRERFHAEPATRSPSCGDAWGPPPAATRV
jgi:hypothetical protein